MAVDEHEKPKSMKRNPLKERLALGEIAYGVMCMEFASTGIGRISASAGAHFAVYDMEHTGWSLETIRLLIATSRSVDMLPIVRVPISDYHHIAHVLDVGAGGIVIPLVKNAAHMREAISYAQYPPMGRRGCAFVLSHDDYQPGYIVEKMRSANESLFMIAQIETVEGLENCDEIAGVQGVDAIWVGQFDLSTSMGIPGQFKNPVFLDALRRVQVACKKNNKTSVLGLMDPAELAKGPSNGYQILVYLADLWIYQQALRTGFQMIEDCNPSQRISTGPI